MAITSQDNLITSRDNLITSRDNFITRQVVVAFCGDYLLLVECVAIKKGNICLRYSLFKVSIV